MIRVCVTGAAGFIGGALIRYLKERGYWVRGVDYVEPRYGAVPCDEGLWDHDLRKAYFAHRAVAGVDWVFHCAADMGGAQHVFSGDFDREIIRNNTLIDVHMIEAAAIANVKRYLFTSSACIYPEYLQDKLEEIWLAESDAYPAQPDSIYGWSKIHTEHLCRAYQKATDMQIFIARLHNVYGERGAWRGDRPKAPAAFCRKIAEAKLTGESVVEMFGDGEQVRSFCYISDALELLYRLMKSDYEEPLNIGTDEAVSINHLAQIVMDIADYQVAIKHIEGPLGVRYRNAALSQMKSVLEYAPKTDLRSGLIPTFQWIESEVKKVLNG